MEKRKESGGRRKAGAPSRRGAAKEEVGDSYHHGNLREALIEGGLRLLTKEGLAGFSLRALAQELGVSHAAPYRHFASRKELLTAIVIESRKRFVDALSKSLSSPENAGESARERLYVLGEAFVGFYLANPEMHYLLNVLPSQLAAHGEKLKEFIFPELAKKQDDGFGLLRETVAELIGDYPGLSERDILLGLWAKVYGLVSILIVQPGYFAPEAPETGIRRLIRQAF